MTNKKRIFIIGIIASLIIVVILSPFSSTKPDGLEKVAEDYKFSDKSYHYLDKFYHFFNDYIVPGIPSEKLSTIVAGLVGITAVTLFSYILLKILVKKENK